MFPLKLLPTSGQRFGHTASFVVVFVVVVVDVVGVGVVVVVSVVGHCSIKIS